MNQIIEGLTSAENTCSNDEIYEMPWDNCQEPSYVDLKKILDDYPINDAIDFTIEPTPSVEKETQTSETHSEYMNNSSLAIALMLITSFGLAAQM